MPRYILEIVGKSDVPQERTLGQWGIATLALSLPYPQSLCISKIKEEAKTPECRTNLSLKNQSTLFLRGLVPLA